MVADDDLILDADDLMDIFGAGEAAAPAGLGSALEDIFFGAEPAAAPAPPPPAKPLAEEAVPQPGTPEYEAFRRQVIERYEKQRQEEEAAARQAEAARQLEKEEYEKRKAEVIARYEAGLKASQPAAPAAPPAPPAPPLPAQDSEALADAEKERKFREYLKTVKAQMASGSLPKPAAHHVAAPKPAAAADGMPLDLPRCLALAAMFEDTRAEMLKKVADRIGGKAAKSLMAKTLEKMLKSHSQVFSRASVDAKGRPLADGALDADRLARTFYSLPEATRKETVRLALFDLIEMRFIAMEMGLGVRVKGHVVSETLNALEQAFHKKNYPADLVKWFNSDVVPSTNLSDGDESTY